MPALASRSVYALLVTRFGSKIQVIANYNIIYAVYWNVIDVFRISWLIKKTLYECIIISNPYNHARQKGYVKKKKNQNEPRNRGANEVEEARRRSREKKMLAIQYFAIMSNNNKST